MSPCLDREMYSCIHKCSVVATLRKKDWKEVSNKYQVLSHWIFTTIGEILQNKFRDVDKNEEAEH